MSVFNALVKHAEQMVKIGVFTKLQDGEARRTRCKADEEKRSASRKHDMDK